MLKRNLSLAQCEDLQREKHLTQDIEVCDLIPLVPMVPNAVLVAHREDSLRVIPVDDGKFLIVDGNQWYYRKLKDVHLIIPAIVYPAGLPNPVISYFLINRHPLSLYTAWLLKETRFSIGELSFLINLSYARIAEAFQALNQIPYAELHKAIQERKHVSLVQLEKVTDSKAKRRGRPKCIPPVNPIDMVRELSAECELPDDLTLRKILERINQISRGKSLAMATLLAAYSKIPDVQPNHKLVRLWLNNLPTFLSQK
jgi:hypothetical protein